MASEPTGGWGRCFACGTWTPLKDMRDVPQESILGRRLVEVCTLCLAQDQQARERSKPNVSVVLPSQGRPML